MSTASPSPLSAKYIRALFNECGMRSTRPREDIYRLLCQRAGEHLCAEQIHTCLRESVPSISLATVYNTLEALEHMNLLRRIAGPDGVARFDIDMEPHAHLVTKDGHIVDVPREISDTIFQEISRNMVPHLERHMGVKIDRAALEFVTDSARNELNAPG